MRFYLVVAVSVVLAVSGGFAQDYVQDFEQGLGGALSYHQAPDDQKIEWITGDAASGQKFVRTALRGQKALEGLYVTATGLKGARLASVTAQVRGKGEVWLCLISANGWLYASQTTALTGQWQECSLAKVLTAQDQSLGVYFISRNVQPGAVFEVDNIRVNLGPAPATSDASVGPWRLEAEAFAQFSSSVQSVAGALGGRAIASDQYAAAMDLPFPRTSRPISIYARVKASAAGDTYRLSTKLGGNTQYLRSAKPAALNEWVWVRFEPSTAGELGDSFGLVCMREKDLAGQIALDSIVVATDAGLTPEQLTAAPLLLGQRPLMVVNRAAAPPKVDGDPADPCWQSTVAAVGFRGLGSAAPAEAATVVRMCYDDANLYMLFECAEPILNTAQQRRHEFLAKMTQRDGEIYADDSVVALLDPSRTGKSAYDFTLNALGTLADARDTAPDLWEQRDLKWNSAAVAKGQIGEDIWWVELAVPFADLGGAPRLGDTWQACLGRLARARKETTSWNACDKGFHDPLEWGALVFGGPGPGLLPAMPGGLQLGRNDFRVTLSSPTSQALYLLTSLGTARGARHDWQYAEGSGQAPQLSQRFEVAAESEVMVGHAVLDAASLSPLWASGVVPRAVRSSVATLRLTCAGPYQLHLNDEVISRGNEARAVEIKAPLQKGANVFALSAQSGTAAVKLEVPGAVSNAGTWKIAPADAKAPTSLATDDGAWEQAPKVGEDAQLGPVVGRAGQPVVLRQTILWEKTRVWPTPEPAFYLARGAAQHLTFIADGLKGRKLADWTTYLAVPLEYEIVGSTGFYGTNRTAQPLFVCAQLGERTVDGKPMRVASVKADKPLLSGQHPIMSQFEVFVRYREQAGEPKADETRFVYWSEANGGAVTEPPQSFKVRLLPALRGAQCKQVVWQLWGGWFSNMDDTALREEVLSCARLSGFNDLVAGDRWTSDHAGRHNIAHTFTTNFEPWGLNVAPYLKAHPDERLIKADGQPHDGRLCMSLLLGAGWPAVEAALQLRLDEVKPHTVDYDYEYSPFTGPHSCYCPRCLQAFREFAKLAGDAPLSAETLKQQHREQWVDFMARRVAAMYARLKEATHRLAPGTLFSAYSGYQTADNPERYGIDWRYMGDLQAVDKAGCGYGRPLEAIDATIKALKGIPLLGGALVVPYDSSVTTPQTPLTKAWLLRVLLDSTGGVLVYDRLTFDGRSWYAMAEATRLVASVEEVFVKGTRGVIAGQDPGLVQAVSSGPVTVVCALNQSGKPAAFKFALPPEAGAGREYYSEKTVRAGETVEFTLQPGDAAAYVLRRQ